MKNKKRAFIVALGTIAYFWPLHANVKQMFSLFLKMTTDNPLLLHEKISDFGNFTRLLQALHYENLPGLESQLKMAPINRLQEIMTLGFGKNAVKSAVLFLFYPDATGCTTTVLIKRPEYNGAHGGQISFPGGRYEIEDIDLKATALRETHEEIGVPPSAVEITGKLTDLFIPPSNFIVSPYLGILKGKPSFVPDQAEVAQVLEFKLTDFFKPENRHTKLITLIGGYTLETPCFVINHHVIWGATAMMINELVEFFKPEKG